MKPKRKKLQGGFTLLELLVVISIISLMSSILLSSVATARRNGRDARRVEDFSTLTKALELYYNDNGQYPTTPTGFCNTSMGDSNCISAATGTTWTTSSGIDNLRGKGYVTMLPADPTNNSSEYYEYKACSDGQSYVLMESIEQNFQRKIISYGPKANIKMADMNNDGVINAADFSLLNGCRVNNPNPYTCPYTGDLNGDGIIDANDLQVLRLLLGQTC